MAIGFAPHTASPTLGEELRSLRVRCGGALSEAARRAAVAKSTLSDWEHGRKTPSGPALERLLDALGAEPRQKARLMVSTSPGYARWAFQDLPIGQPVDAGHLMRAMRLRRGLTQAETARRAGVTQSAVAKWESGESLLEGAALHNACFALGASPEECAALVSATVSDPTEDLDYEARRLEIDYAPKRLQPVMRLGLEADLWKRAVRNPVWDGPLCDTKALRVYESRLTGQYDAVVPGAREVFRLAQSSGAWQEATPAFMALHTVWRHKKKPFAERKIRTQRWIDRLGNSHVRMWPLGVMAEYLAYEGDEKGAIELMRRVREVLDPLDSDGDFHSRQAFAAVRLAAGNGAAVLEILDGNDHRMLLTLKIKAMLSLGKEPPEAWLESFRTYVRTEGLVYQEEQLADIETGLARLRRQT